MADLTAVGRKPWHARFRRFSLTHNPKHADPADDAMAGLKSEEWKDYPDLWSGDRAKMKTAMNQYLHDKVRDDWTFEWPPRERDSPTSEASPSQPKSRNRDDSRANEVDHTAAVVETQVGAAAAATLQMEPSPLYDQQPQAVESGYEVDDDAESVSSYSSISDEEDQLRYRTEWASELSDENVPDTRSDNTETVGIVIRAESLVKRAKRRRALRQEARWNEGLACFEARRNAWTGARTVRVRYRAPSQPPPPRSPPLSKRFFFRKSISEATNPAAPGSPISNNGSPLAVRNSDSSESAELERMRTKESAPFGNSADQALPSEAAVEVILPVPLPILPPNSMRRSIGPQLYLAIYDKTIVNGLSPSCPINLSDILKSCVAGWKRDDEWPPKAVPPEPRLTSGRPSVHRSDLPTLLSKRKNIVDLFSGSAGAAESSHSRGVSWGNIFSFQRKNEDRIRGL